MRAEPAGVIVNSGLDEYQELTSKGFLPLTGALCTFCRSRGLTPRPLALQRGGEGKQSLPHHAP